VASLLKKYKSPLGDIKPDQLPGGDTLPLQIGKLMALRMKMLKDHNTDIFTHLTSRVVLRGATIGNLPGLGLGKLLPKGILPVGPEDVFTGTGPEIIRPSGPISPLRQSGVLVGQFNDTKEAGIYNVVVTAMGTSPISKKRFVRKALVSVLIR
jgi:hypothetical protein